MLKYSAAAEKISRLKYEVNNIKDVYAMQSLFIWRKQSWYYPEILTHKENFYLFLLSVWLRQTCTRMSFFLLLSLLSSNCHFNLKGHCLHTISLEYPNSAIWIQASLFNCTKTSLNVMFHHKTRFLQTRYKWNKTHQNILSFPNHLWFVWNKSSFHQVRCENIPALS